MGNEEVKAAVSDAGPLIHLCEIDGLPLLHIFDVIHLPHAVNVEISDSRENISKEICVTVHRISETKTSLFIIEKGLENLHAGEIGCLYLCKQINLPILLTDDLSVRDAAKSFQITPVGSLGIVVKAYKRGLISLVEAEQRITDLYDISSLFVTRTIVELAIEQLHRQGKPGT